MTIKEITEALKFTVYAEGDGLGANVTGGYVSDLLSDVMGHSKEGELWVTLQSHMNVVAIASLKELSAIVLVKGIVPGADVIRKAIEEGIPLLGTDSGTFDTAGKLFKILNG